MNEEHGVQLCCLNVDPQLRQQHIVMIFNIHSYKMMPSSINRKINDTPKGFYVPISKLHSISALVNLLALNNITISYYVQINLLRLKSSVVSKWARRHLWEYHLFCC